MDIVPTVREKFKPTSISVWVVIEGFPHINFFAERRILVSRALPVFIIYHICRLMSYRLFSMGFVLVLRFPSGKWLRHVQQDPRSLDSITQWTLSATEVYIGLGTARFILIAALFLHLWR